LGIIAGREGTRLTSAALLHTQPDKTMKAMETSTQPVPGASLAIVESVTIAGREGVAAYTWRIAVV
jgi:hypothetical protein